MSCVVCVVRRCVASGGLTEAGFRLAQRASCSSRTARNERHREYTPQEEVASYIYLLRFGTEDMRFALYEDPLRWSQTMSKIANKVEIMSFAFGFGGDDIEDENDHDDIVQRVENCSLDDTPLLPPKSHTLQELLSSLPSQISYNLLSVARQQNGDNMATHRLLIPRRSVFDIRAQLMAEAQPDNNNDAMLAGLESGDLTSSIYEGGFKTWECSLDLVPLVAELNVDNGLHIIELGAGSAVPSLMTLQNVLKQSNNGPVHFTLCDYNEDVLRLATAPNIFLATETSRLIASQIDQPEDLDIEDIDEGKIEACQQLLQARNISFGFVSGAWGEDFLHLITRSDQSVSVQSRTKIILASETIYSPKSTGTFVNILMQLLRRDTANTRAWVAAKKVYFGVGGSVDDFVAQVEQQGGSVKTLLNITGGGVGRVVLEITAK